MRLAYSRMIADGHQRDAATDELLKMPAHSLLIDDQVYRIQPAAKFIENGRFNGAYNLSFRETEALRKAERVGVALQFNYDAPVFLGFDDMPIADGKPKLLGVLNQCKPHGRN